MSETIKKICEEFSKGNFDLAYSHFDENIQWNNIGGQMIKGKTDVIAFCDKMTKEMEGSVLNNTHIISDENSMAIEGFCDYINAEGKPMAVEYCDVYRIENEKINNITSYCISSVK